VVAGRIELMSGGYDYPQELKDTPVGRTNRLRFADSGASSRATRIADRIALSCDFSHTAVLNGLCVFQNSNGTNPVSNATFTSPDGVTYAANGVVPEPNSLLLLATGLASVALICRKRRLANPSR
jgi:hypothetical protein